MNKKITILTAIALLSGMNVSAQLSSNKDKFLGNITTTYQVDYGKEKFYTLWNQITPENESKWDAIEGSRRGSFNFSGADNAYNYAKQHNFPFKFHTFIWGGQYPNWMNSLSKEEQYKAIEEYMDAVKKHYPELPLIDVVNEAVSNHRNEFLRTNSLWMQIIGPEYIYYSFLYMREAGARYAEQYKDLYNLCYITVA